MCRMDRKDKPDVYMYLISILCLLTGSWASDMYLSCSTSILRYRDDQFTPVIQDLGRVVSLGLDAHLGLLFWSDVSGSRRGIYRTNTDAFAPVQRIITDIGVVSGLGLDTARHHIYWTDEGRGTLEVARYDGSDRAVLVGDRLSLPRGVLVQEPNGFVFWGDQGTGLIERSRLDGQERVTVASNTIWPNGIVWDPQTSSLLWVDGWTNNVMTSDVNGDSQRIVSDLSITANTSSLFGLSLNTDQYVTTLRDGRIIYVLPNGQTSHVVDVVESAQNCSELFGIVTNDSVKTIKTNISKPNPCSTGGSQPCSHLCLPINQSVYQCACPTIGGLSLVNMTSCEVPSDVILYTTSAGEIGFLDLNQPDVLQSAMIGRSAHPVALAYDAVEQMVFYSDTAENRIYRIAFNGTGREVFLDADDGIGIVNDMAVDFVQRHLYFTNYGVVGCNGTVFTWHKIEMASLDGKRRYVLREGATRPHALTLDLRQRVVYFADRSDRSDSLWEMDLAGQQKRRIDLGFKESVEISSITVTTSSNLSTIYMVASTPSQSWGVYQVSLTSNRTRPRTRLLQIPIKNAAVVTSMESILFLNNQTDGSIVSYDTDSGDVSVVRHKTDVTQVIYSRQQYSSSVVDVCSSKPNEPDCSDGCVRQAGINTSSSSISCLCAVGGLKDLDPDTHSCAEPRTSLVFADVTSIKSIKYGASLGAVPSTVHTLHQRNIRYSNIVGLTFDPDTDLLYFSDGNSGVIHTLTITADRQRVFFDSTQRPGGDPQVIDSLTIDHVSTPKRLLWTSYKEGTICAMDTSGNNATYRELLTGLDGPRAIIVDEYSKRLYWSECGANTRVRGASMNGENVITVLEHGLMWPNALLLHPETRQLYIADGQDGNIYICGTNNTADWSCEQTNTTGSMTHIFSMILVEQSLYLTSWVTSSVDRVDLRTGQREVIVEGLVRPTQLIMVARKSRATGCSSNRSDCGLSDQRDAEPSRYVPFGILGVVLLIIAVVAVVVVVLWRKKRDWFPLGGLRIGRACSIDHACLVTSDSESKIPLDDMSKVFSKPNF